jgi:hypothetical protein
MVVFRCGSWEPEAEADAPHQGSEVFPLFSPEGED